MIEEGNRIPQIEHELMLLDHYSVRAGILDSAGDFLQMIAMVNDTGAHIVAHKKSLTIPTAAAKGRKPSEIEGLFKPKGKMILAVADKSQKNGLLVMFYLKKEVHIPARPFLEQTENQFSAMWADEFMHGVGNIIDGTGTAKDLYTKLGKLMAQQIQARAHLLDSPQNAAATVERKGNDDPLIDTGKLVKAIDWEVVKI